MSSEKPVLLCDFGGTHGRLGILHAAKDIEHLQKYALADFKSHLDLFDTYRSDTGIDVEKVAVAAAGAHTGTHFQSGFQEDSKVSEGYFKSGGYDLVACLNDFEATAWGVPGYPHQPVVLKDTVSLDPGTPKCIIGPGTGLGCALIQESASGTTIFKTSGGHMRPCFATPEQQDVLSRLQVMKERAVIYEDIASGRGMSLLYRMYTGDELEGTHQIINDPDHKVHKKVLRLFHEFLGLYIQNVIVTSYAYGGIYLHGGLLDALYSRGLFDFDKVNEMVCQPYVEVIEARLSSVPVVYIEDTYLALYGLKNYLGTENR